MRCMILDERENTPRQEMLVKLDESGMTKVRKFCNCLLFTCSNQIPRTRLREIESW